MGQAKQEFSFSAAQQANSKAVSEASRGWRSVKNSIGDVGGRRSEATMESPAYDKYIRWNHWMATFGCVHKIIFIILRFKKSQRVDLF